MKTAKDYIIVDFLPGICYNYIGKIYIKIKIYLEEINMIKQLVLTLPTSVLDKIGVIEGSEELRETLQEIFQSSSSDEINFGSLTNNIDRIENSFFIPIVVKKMIETNKKFSEALKLSEDEIRNKVDELNSQISDETEKEMIIYLVSDLLSCYSNLVDKEKVRKTINCTLQDLSPEFYKALEIYKVIALAKQIVPRVYNEIKRVVVDPLKESFSDAIENIINKKAEVSEELDTCDIEIIKVIIKNQVDSIINELYSSIPLQVVISKVIEKAINEDLTFMKALLSFQFIELVEQVIFEINNDDSYDPENLKESFQEMIEKIFDLM